MYLLYMPLLRSENRLNEIRYETFYYQILYDMLLWVSYNQKLVSTWKCKYINYVSVSLFFHIHLYKNHIIIYIIFLQ